MVIFHCMLKTWDTILFGRQYASVVLSCDNNQFQLLGFCSLRQKWTKKAAVPQQKFRNPYTQRIRKESAAIRYMDCRKKRISLWPHRPHLPLVPCRHGHPPFLAVHSSVAAAARSMKFLVYVCKVDRCSFTDCSRALRLFLSDRYYHHIAVIIRDIHCPRFLPSLWRSVRRRWPRWWWINVSDRLWDLDCV